MKLAKFTSSEIYRLTGGIKKPDAKFRTYVMEKKAETNVGRRISTGGSKATNWGNLCEEWLLVEHLDLSFKPCYKSSIQHKEIKCYSGTPDYIRETIVGDIKSPQLKAFGLLSMATTGEELKEIEPKYYWQLVSNYILAGQENKIDTCELLLFTPTEAQAVEILEYNGKKATKDLEDWKCPYYSYLDYIQDVRKELPILGEEALIKSTHSIQFTPPKEDVEFLLERVKLADKELQEWANK